MDPSAAPKPHHLTGRSSRLDRKNLAKATEMLGQLAGDLGISTEQIRRHARQIIEEELDTRAERDRFGLNL